MSEDLREILADIDEELILWDGFDEAVIGIGERCGMTVVVYDLELIIETLMESSQCTYEEAYEYYDFNILGSYVGEKTPIVVDSIKKYL